VDDEDWDLFGIADVGPLNEKARPGRRPKDLWPTAKAVLMFAVGLADPFTRGWVQNGKSGKFYSYALLELDRRVWTVKRFLRQEGYLYFGGEAYGGALFDTGIRFADAAADCGMGYIGKSNVLVTEKYGPRINMTYLMTDAPLVTTIKEVPVRCGRCTACQKVCMSGAILGDYYFHQRQCEAIINVKPNMDYYSDFVKQDCDRCLRVCPRSISRFSASSTSTCCQRKRKHSSTAMVLSLMLLFSLGRPSPSRSSLPSRRLPAIVATVSRRVPSSSPWAILWASAKR
jgi:epoxyqueuosine reductase QueG